jgi:UDP-3-O-[3-hydroxymyristoyl] glucosamine N-acyltransferase
MKLNPPQTLSGIAAIIGCEYDGDPDFPVTGINEIHRVEPGDIVFVDHPKYYDKALRCAATVVLINQKVERPEGKALVFSDNPFSDYNKLTRHFSPFNWSAGTSGTGVKIGADCHIHSTVVMGNNVQIGDGCIIHPGVVLYDNVSLGNHVIIHANCVLGADAFYYKARPGGREKMYTCGSVVIEDHVEIGAMCTVDRGVSADTRIGSGTKIDDHVHIGHDTVVGKNCLFAAQVGLAGCVVVEDDVILWGQVGVPSNLRIGKGAIVLGQSGLMRDAEAGKTYFGSPAEESKQKLRELAYVRKLPAIIEKLDSLKPAK